MTDLKALAGTRIKQVLPKAAGTSIEIELTNEDGTSAGSLFISPLLTASGNEARATLNLTVWP